MWIYCNAIGNHNQWECRVFGLWARRWHRKSLASVNWYHLFSYNLCNRLFFSLSPLLANCIHKTDKKNTREVLLFTMLRRTKTKTQIKEHKHTADIELSVLDAFKIQITPCNIVCMCANDSIWFSNIFFVFRMLSKLLQLHSGCCILMNRDSMVAKSIQFYDLPKVKKCMDLQVIHCTASINSFPPISS